MFSDRGEHAILLRFLGEWEDVDHGVKAAFIRLKERLSTTAGRLSFKQRPGVSHSLRAYLNESEENSSGLFALVDIIDDDPESRWLSVCFYEYTITDPEERGNMVPLGILGEDGYCFDVTEHDADLLAYLKNRIDEAYENAARGTGNRA